MQTFPFFVSAVQTQDFFITMWRNSICHEMFSDEALKIICNQFIEIKREVPIKFDPVNINNTYQEMTWADVINRYYLDFNEYIQDHYGGDDSFTLQTFFDMDSDDICEVLSEIDVPGLIGYNIEEDVYVIRS